MTPTPTKYKPGDLIRHINDPPLWAIIVAIVPDVNSTEDRYRMLLLDPNRIGHYNTYAVDDNFNLVCSP